MKLFLSTFYAFTMPVRPATPAFVRMPHMAFADYGFDVFCILMTVVLPLVISFWIAQR